jgi:hypothetical protein
MLAMVLGSTDAGQHTITLDPQRPSSYLSFMVDASSISGRPESVFNPKNERILLANLNSGNNLSHKISETISEDNSKESKTPSNFYIASLSNTDHRIKVAGIENKSQSLTMPNALWLYLIGFILFFCAKSPSNKSNDA